MPKPIKTAKTSKPKKRDQSLLDWLGGGILHSMDHKLNIIIEGEQQIMADLTGINDALASQSAALGELGTQITQLAEQVAALDADDVTQEQLDDIAAQMNAVATGITDSAAAVDAIVTTDDVEPAPEPAPEEPQP